MSERLPHRSAFAFTHEHSFRLVPVMESNEVNRA